jgi:hypothetical protein
MAFENQAKLVKLYCLIVDKSLNSAFNSALEIVLITDVKCITKQQYSSDLLNLSLKIKRNCVVDKSLKIIKLIIKKCSTFDPW